VEYPQPDQYLDRYKNNLSIQELEEVEG
jgi:hypothetical protein